jgi:DNA-binding NarL/FixJ family response regulator
MKPTGKTKVLIAEETEVTRKGIRTLLEKAGVDIEVVGEVTNSLIAAQKVAELRPNVLLMSSQLPGPDLYTIIQEIKRWAPGLHILIMCSKGETPPAALLKAGASGFVFLEASQQELLAALSALKQDDLYTHPSAAGAVVGDVLRALSSSLRYSEREQAPREVQEQQAIEKRTEAQVLSPKESRWKMLAEDPARWRRIAITGHFRKAPRGCLPVTALVALPAQKDAQTVAVEENDGQGDPHPLGR